MIIKKKTLPIAVISMGLGMSLLFNNSFAAHVHEGELTEKAPPPVQKTPPAKKAVPSEKPSPDITLLKETVSKYIIAQKKQDFKAMRSFESWEGGDVLDDVKYIQSFRSNFQIEQWKITQMKLIDGEYRVFIWVTHNPPKEMAGYLAPGKTVRSTLVQWWKKQNDKFVHLFHIERKRLMKWIPQIEKPKIAPKSPAT